MDAVSQCYLNYSNILRELEDRLNAGEKLPEGYIENRFKEFHDK
jgi:hypothetical protein